MQCASDAKVLGKSLVQRLMSTVSGKCLGLHVQNLCSRSPHVAKKSPTDQRRRSALFAASSSPRPLSSPVCTRCIRRNPQPFRLLPPPCHTPAYVETFIFFVSPSSPLGTRQHAQKTLTCLPRSSPSPTHPNAGGVSIRSRNGAPSRKGCVVNGQTTKASNK